VSGAGAPSAREAILASVRAALADHPEVPPSPALSPARAADLGGDALVARFVERVADYRATVTVVGDDDEVLQATIADAFARHAAQAIAIPHDFPARWRPAGLTFHESVPGAHPDPRALAALDGVLTTSAAALAETGTIVLDAGPGQGPRALTLLPDVHVCVVDASAIVPGVPGGLPALRSARPVTLISGPSATSDIELDRVEGVHGPRRLEVVVRDDR
jgi:L-lactate dehydrogenase complex protein LldG